jgi:dynein heavy chain, axonemal
MADDLDISDSRVKFMASYLIKTLKLKEEKWNRMYAIEENKIAIQDFLDKNEENIIVFLINSTQTLVYQFTYPNNVKSKACYFAKKAGKDALSKDINIKDALLYGDLSYAPIDQLSAILDEVSYFFSNFKL